MDTEVRRQRKIHLALAIAESESRSGSLSKRDVRIMRAKTRLGTGLAHALKFSGRRSVPRFIPWPLVPCPSSRAKLRHSSVRRPGLHRWVQPALLGDHAGHVSVDP